MENGWIKLHRKMINNPIWQKSNYVAIWIYLLLHANHQEKEIIWNNKKTTIEKGCFIGSIKKISDHYGLSTGTVSYILNYFISENMIEKRSNKKFTYFKIKNWDKYQSVENNVENKLKTNEKQAETNKNVKNDNNIYSKAKKISAYKMKLHDGSTAILRYGVWTDERDANVKIDPHYYPEINNL